MVSSLRIPDVLRARIDKAAGGSGKRSEWILEACRMRLDGPIPGKVVSVGTVQPPDGLPPIPYFQVESTDFPSLKRKPDMAALREICAGNTPAMPSDAYYDAGAGVHSTLQPRLCVVCDSPMREVKGKWACADQSCAMYGREVKK